MKEPGNSLKMLIGKTAGKKYLEKSRIFLSKEMRIRSGESLPVRNFIDSTVHLTKLNGL